MRSLQIYCRDFQYLYPSTLLHLLIRDGEYALICIEGPDLLLIITDVAMVFFIVSIENHIVQHSTEDNDQISIFGDSLTIASW